MQQRELGLEPQQVVFCSQVSSAWHDAVAAIAMSSGGTMTAAVADQVLVDEDAREGRDDQPGDDQQQAASTT